MSLYACAPFTAYIRTGWWWIDLEDSGRQPRGRGCQLHAGDIQEGPTQSKRCSTVLCTARPTLSSGLSRHRSFHIDAPMWMLAVLAMNVFILALMDDKVTRESQNYLVISQAGVMRPSPSVPRPLCRITLYPCDTASVPRCSASHTVLLWRRAWHENLKLIVGHGDCESARTSLDPKCGRQRVYQAIFLWVF